MTIMYENFEEFLEAADKNKTGTIYMFPRKTIIKDKGVFSMDITFSFKEKKEWHKHTTKNNIECITANEHYFLWLQQFPSVNIDNIRKEYETLLAKYNNEYDEQIKAAKALFEKNHVVVEAEIQ